MDLNVMVQLIGSLGFPIAMCIWMAKHMQNMQEKHADEINALREVVQENTIALVKLVDKIDAGIKLKED